MNVSSGIGLRGSPRQIAVKQLWVCVGVLLHILCSEMCEQFLNGTSAHCRLLSAISEMGKCYGNQCKETAVPF